MRFGSCLRWWLEEILMLTWAVCGRTGLGTPNYEKLLEVFMGMP